MFERNRIDNTPATTAVPVSLTQLDGREEKGRLLVPLGRNLGEYLNSTSPFMEFEPYGGERTFIAKAQIAALKPIGIPKVNELNTRALSANDFDPHATLGVTPGADWSQIRAAYVERAKAYHPDRYATAELPKDVRDYLSAIARRVNLAFEILEQAQLSHKAVVEAKTVPVYTSRGRV